MWNAMKMKEKFSWSDNVVLVAVEKIGGLQRKEKGHLVKIFYVN